mgnify:FL=1|jgi:hypothetical protein
MALSKITTESLLDGEITAAKFATGIGGKVVQVVRTQSGAVATGTTTSPGDDTIPQNNEGIAFAALDTAITPTNTNNTLLITVDAQFAHTTGVTDRLMMALFQDSTANALANQHYTQKGANLQEVHRLSFSMTAGTTSATTFKMRCGMSTAGTLTMNGAGGSRVGGGVNYSSMTIMEILV